MNKYTKRLLEEWIQHGKIIISVDYDDTLFPWKMGNDDDVNILQEAINYLNKFKNNVI